MTSNDYLRSVGSALRDLPWRQRHELLAELRGHLADFPADTDLAKRLGTPEQYAADLRAAEGIEQRRGPIAFLRARRPRNLVLVTVLATVLVLAIGFTITAVVYVDSYQPLADFKAAGVLVRGGDPRPTPGEAGYTVSFRKGQPFWYGIPIINNGRFAVRVLGVPRGAVAFFAGRLVMSDRTIDFSHGPFFSDGPFEPFHPFDLRPGSFRWLVFKGVFACNGGAKNRQNGAMGEAFPVRYQFHWKTATAEIPLDKTLTFSFHTGGCLRAFPIRTVRPRP